jgi:AraC family transcriptional regulator
MILGKHGVTVARQQNWRHFGVEETAYEIRWLADDAWMTLQAELPTLFMAASEVGGRCELRARPDRPVDGQYFGSDALTFAGPGSRVAVYAAQMRQARLCCFALRASDANYIPQDQAAAIACLPSRYMFRNPRISTCVRLLDADRLRSVTNAAYTFSLSKALFASVLDMTNEPYQQPIPAALTGTHWHLVAGYLRDHFREPVSVATLAGLVRMPPEQFGAAFQAATGMSLRQWQMDYRVRGAQRLLTDDPHASLAKVAALCGFQDQSHFSRAFYKVAGQTPTAWLHSRT